MKDNAFLGFIEEGRFDEVEDLWLEQMESGESSVDDFLHVAKALGRQKEKERAGLLLGLLSDNLLEKQRWADRLHVLKEIARHIHQPDKLEHVRSQIRDTLLHLYPGRTSFEQILRHYRYDAIDQPEQLRQTLAKIEWWLSHDVDEVFYQTGYGTGRIREINLNLGLVRIDFEGRKDITIQMGDADLIPLPKGHILREKVESLEQFRQSAFQDPSVLLGRCCRRGLFLSRFANAE